MSSTIAFNYNFRLDDGTERIFTLQLEASTLDLISEQRDAQPAWTALECQQCPNCPLKPAEHPQCPIAANLVDLVDFFKGTYSYEEVDVRLETPERSYSKRTSVQQAVSSVLGIYMVTSGCPIMNKLRPMVRFHLPFATIAETAYRAIAMYLMAQYFRKKRGLEPDWDLRDLALIYEDIQRVNTSFLKRLDEIETRDASANALVILDCFASQVAFSIDEEDLSEFEVFFAPYLQKDEK